MINLPAAFTERMKQMLGREYDAFIASYDKERSQGLRVNGLKTDPAEFAKTAPFSLNPVAWAAEGFAYGAEDRPGRHPYHDAGVYYIQEPSAMIAASLLNPQPGEMILDLCAAPGGKSTQAAARLGGEGLLVSNEIHPARAKILSQNIERMGIRNAVVTNEDSGRLTKYFPAFFDGIIVDAPCSGEGMFRKDETAVTEWSPENVEICWQRQRRIIADIWPCLKPGGILIYSTCTYNTKENEENIRWIRDEFGAEVLPLDVAEEWNITGNLLQGESFPVYRFLPHKTQGEGFFLAVLRKSGMSVRNSGDKQLISLAIAPETPGRRVEKSREKGRKVQGKGKQTPGLSKEQLAILQKWIFTADKYEFIQKGGNVSAFPKCYLPELSALQSSLRIVQAGLEIAGQKGKDWIPCHALAVSGILVSDAFPCEEISYEQAIVYLRKEAVTLSDAAPRGVVLLTYKHVPLGFVKNIGNRANNLYPQEWRIRSGYLPETVVKVHS